MRETSSRGPRTQNDATNSERRRSTTSRASRARVPGDDRSPVEKLQRTVGNEAIRQFVERGVRGERPTESRSAERIAATGRRGTPAETVDLSSNRGDESETVAIYENAASRRAASRLGAFGYAWNGDVFVGPGVGRADGPDRNRVISHELVHARQMRQDGPRAAESALEREADAGGDPTYRANPETPLRIAWGPLLAAGLAFGHVMLRSKPANAPDRGEETYDGPSDLQIATEAFVANAIPVGVGVKLAKLGYGVVSVSVLSSGAGAVANRGVGDAFRGEVSSIDAYVVDAATEATIGLVIDGALVRISTVRSGGSDAPVQGITDETGDALPIAAGDAAAGRSGRDPLVISVTQHRSSITSETTGRSPFLPGSPYDPFSNPLAGSGGGTRFGPTGGDGNRGGTAGNEVTGTERPSSNADRTARGADEGGAGGVGRGGANASGYTTVRTPWGRTVHQRNDIDWDLRRPDGKTNLEAAQEGLAPGRYNPDTASFERIQLHHSNQQPHDSLVEVWRTTHQAHPHRMREGLPSWRTIDPEAARGYNDERAVYWKWRAGRADLPFDRYFQQFDFTIRKPLP